MADNEIKYSGLSDVRLAATLSSNFLLLLAERSVILDHPALAYVGRINGTGSTTFKVPQLGLMGYNLPTVDASENTDVDETALTDASSTVEVARYVKVYTATDLARLTSPYGELEPEMMAMDAMITAQLLFSSLVANLVDNFANVSGTSGVRLDLATYMSAQAALEARSNDGMFLCVLHSTGWSALKEEMALVSGGAIQWNPATAEQISRTGRGFKGNLLGTDVVSTNMVPASSSDRVGGMFARGALAWADGSPLARRQDQVALGASTMLEEERLGTKGETRFIQSNLMGASEAIDTAGQSIIHLGS